LPIIVAWLRLNWGKIVLGGAVFAIIALFIGLAQPKIYDAEITLLVSPPEFKESNSTSNAISQPGQLSSIAEMMPQALPMEAYKAIALSAPLLDEVIQRLSLEDTGLRGFRKQLEVELVQMGGPARGTVYTLLLIFHAKADSPELAAKTAQTWADMFKEHVDGLASKGIGETFSLLADLHRNNEGELDQAALALAEHRKVWNLELSEAQLDAKQAQYTSFEGTLKQTEVEFATEEMKLRALETELAKEDKKDVYFRAPSDDAYWIAGLQNGGEPKIEPEKGLRTEELNPIYEVIRTSVVNAESEVEGLKATKGVLVQKLGEIKKEIDALTTTLSDETVERDKLTREWESLSISYIAVRAKYELGRMADQTRASDIQVAGKAVASDEPVTWSITRLLLVGAVLGMFVTAGCLMLKAISEPVLSLGAGGMSAIMTRALGRAPAEPSPELGAGAGGHENSEKPG
jgi:capsular polysaccharide biosynthesis protein